MELGVDGHVFAKPQADPFTQIATGLECLVMLTRVTFSLRK